MGLESCINVLGDDQFFAEGFFYIHDLLRSAVNYCGIVSPINLSSWSVVFEIAFVLFFSFSHRVSQVFRKNNIYIKGQLATGWVVNYNNRMKFPETATEHLDNSGENILYIINSSEM